MSQSPPYGGSPAAVPRPVPRPGTAIRAMVALAITTAALAGCVETVDLRTPTEVPPTCDPGERLDPASGACAPCTVDPPPPATDYPCGAQWEPGPYPACEGDSVLAGPVPCTGDIGACVGYDVGAGTTTSCAALFACCAELARDPASEPCCPAGAELICAPTSNLGQYRVTCAPGCCLGAPCDSDAACEPWQTCDGSSGRCVPACQTGVTECGVDCTCKQVPQPG